MIRATTSAAASRPTVRSTSAGRPVVLLLLLLTVFALVGTALAQGAAAAGSSRDEIWVSADGVAFDRGRQSDEVAYVVRPTGRSGEGRAFARDLTREEQYQGWTSFREARQAYPDGYCVVWVEVEDASSWHETDDRTACTAAAPPETATPTPTPRPTPTEDADDRAQPASRPAQDRPTPPTSAPTPTPTATSTPTPTPSATPSPTRSASASGTPSPSPSTASPVATPTQSTGEQPPIRTMMDAAGEQDEVIPSLGWVVVLGTGALLTAGGFLLLWRRLT